LNNNNNSEMRIFILNLIMVLGGVILVAQLFNLQIVQGSSYRAQSEKRVLRQTTVSAPRGEMLDRHGAILATNRDGYNVLIYKQSMSTKERNEFILRLAKLLKSKNTVYRDTFPISVLDDELTFEFDSDTAEKRWKKNNKFSENATCEEVINSYIKKEGRALPVFILLDVSGSMKGEKIETVNVALKEMLNSFRKIENPKGIIELCLITFGGNKVEVIKELSKIENSDVYTFTASGNTPMGAAFEKAAEMIEDKNIVSSRAYTPTIILISDGNPTDYDFSGKSIEEIMTWESLKKLHFGTRASKAAKLAMGIGEDVDLNILKAFINNNQIPVISAKNNNTILKFFEWVTMSVSVRSVSNNPNQAVIEDTYIFDKDEIQF